MFFFFLLCSVTIFGPFPLALVLTYINIEVLTKPLVKVLKFEWGLCFKASCYKITNNDSNYKYLYVHNACDFHQVCKAQKYMTLSAVGMTVTCDSNHMHMHGDVIQFMSQN